MENTKSEEAPQPQFSLQGIYLRHISLETASSPILRNAQAKPEMKLELRINTHLVGTFQEVVLDVTVTAKEDSNLFYLLKIQQAGSFTVTGFTEEQKALILNTTCPHLLYPYVSQMANTLVVQAGYPPVNLMPIDFAHWYAQQSSPANEAAKSTEEAKPVPSANQAQPITTKWAKLTSSEPEPVN